MTQDTRDHEIIGRPEADGVVRLQFDLWRAVQWVTLLGGIIGIAIWGAKAIGDSVVKPKAFAEVTAAQARFDSVQTLQNARLTGMETQLGQLQLVVEIVAIDACGRLKKSDLYAYRKANCAEYDGPASPDL